jgi:DNA polymerase V
LFPEPNPVAERAAGTKKFVNKKAGRFASRSGDTLPLREVYGDPQQQYDICDVEGKLCF